MEKIFLLVPMMVLVSCAEMYHTQVGDIDNRNVDGTSYTGQRFEVKVSDIGVNVEGAGEISKAIFSNHHDEENIDDIATIIELFQVGPTTGNGVYNDKYAESILAVLHQKCPSGRISGLTSIRENRKYPAISGEIVKIVGYCQQ